MIPPTNPDMGRSALWYAQHGIFTFPAHNPLFDHPAGWLCTCEDWRHSDRCKEKMPHRYLEPGDHCDGPGKCPRGKWRDESTTDADTIRGWWKRWPNANIGIDCGKSGLLVLDADTYKETFIGGDLLTRSDEETVTVLTGGGGVHLWYRRPEDKEWGNAKKGLPAGIDIRGAGGYVIAPPSLHGSGRRYAFEAGYALHEGDLLPVPGWLAAILDKAPGAVGAVTLPDVTTAQPDLTQWRLSSHILDAIATPAAKGGRSEADQSVITALVKAGATDVGILGVFQHNPIGTAGKFAERGITYLGQSIGRARVYYQERQAEEMTEYDPPPNVGNDDPASVWGNSAIGTPPWGDETSPTIRYQNQFEPAIYTNGYGAAPKTAAKCEPDAMPELPESARIDPSLAQNGCRWLDEYERFSRLWSPRGWDDFHAGAGLWILSTIAARRIVLPFGGNRYTNLYIAFVAYTTLHAKSGTAKIAGHTLQAAGLGHLRTHGDSTPQAFIQNLAQSAIDINPDTPQQTIDELKERLLFAGQRGWLFDEFGGKISAMMREGSVMSEYRALLLRFDDSEPIYEYKTISRGTETVHNPYLSLLCNATPAYLQPFASRGAPLWQDGFWARFVMLCPPENTERKRGRFPDGNQIIPDSLTAPLRDWHERLGEPHIAQMDIYKTNKDGSEGGIEKIRLYNDSDHHPANVCRIGAGVVDAFYAYNEALLDVAADNKDLLGNYGRMAEKALRVAMLFASLENEGLIEMRHWAKAQQLTELWRQNLHNLYALLTSQVAQTTHRSYQDAIIRQLSAEDGLTQRELTQKIRGLDAKSAAEILEAMIKGGILGVRQNNRRLEYVILSPDV